MEKLQDRDRPLKLAVIAGCGMFLSTLDSGIINIAIPSLIKAFNTNVAVVIWTVTLYTLMLSTSILLFGRIADRVGRLKIYMFGLILFAVSSFLCGASASVYLLIAFRGLQGLSAAMLQATSLALFTTRLQGAQLTKAMGIFGMLIGLGPMMGPVVGGFILSTLDWRWIFWINIPICLLGLYGCKQLPKVKEDLHSIPTYYVNLMLIALTLFSLLMTISFFSYQKIHYGLIALGVSAAAFIIYFYADLKAKHPIIPLTLFKELNFVTPILGVMAYGGATAVSFMLPPLYFEKIRHFQAWQVGLISLSAPLGIIIAARIAANIVHKYGTIKPMIIGLTIMFFALGILTQITMTWPVYIVFLLLMVYGLGGGLFQTPSYLNIMGQFPKHRQAFISSLIRMLQNLAVAFEAAGAALLINLQLKSGAHLLIGIKRAWLMSTIIIAIAMISFCIRFILKEK